MSQPDDLAEPDPPYSDAYPLHGLQYDTHREDDCLWRPLSSPTQQEKNAFSMDIEPRRYDPSKRDTIYLEDHEFCPPERFRPGTRVTWIPDHRSNHRWLPRSAPTTHAMSFWFQLNPPRYLEDDPRKCTSTRNLELIIDSSEDLDTDRLTTGQLYMLEHLWLKMDENLVASGPDADPKIAPFLPHGVFEYNKDNGTKEFSWQRDADQDILQLQWQGDHGSLLSHHLKLDPLDYELEDGRKITPEREETKPLDLEIYPIPGFATICYAPEIKMVRLTRSSPGEYKYDSDQNLIRGIFCPMTGMRLNPPYCLVQESRQRHMESLAQA